MIVVVGLSHREAPLHVRERLAVDGEAVEALLRELVASSEVSEALCISTCNRIEVYAASNSKTQADTAKAARRVEKALDDLARKNGASGVVPYLKTYVEGEAVRHIFRVASSLDSLVVGEPQILGQVKSAYETAKTVGSVGQFLERAMSRALHVAKRVRTETAIGEGQVSIASVAVDLARQIFGDLAGRSALLLGAGEMAEGAAKLLVKAGAKLEVVNRSPERAAILAREYDGVARAWEELESALVSADVVVASTAAKHFVLTRAMTAKAMKARRGRSLFFIDIAVPRDVEPQVNELDNVYVYDIDNLSNVVADSMRGRKAEADRAESLVEHEANNFEGWAESRGAAGTIAALRTKVRSSLVGELEKSLAGRLRHLGDADKKAMNAMIEAAVNKLLHVPISRIKASAGEPNGERLVEAIRQLFDLSEFPSEVEAAGDASSEPAEASSVPTLAQRETARR
ncbi:MAG TPA: glutamyl-tRNA reductase [Polyangiaceae bacterium]|nr:glutamyl-tRNA reductase [Polyangiaceae bacterium]